MAEQARVESQLKAVPPLPSPDDVSHQRSYLLVFEAGAASVHFLQPDQPMMIGRGEPAGLSVADPTVARAHARITACGAGALLEDLGSPTGTRVNGERLESNRELQPGDVISVGAATLVFHRDAQSRSRQRVLQPRQLRERIVEEAERARRHGRPLVVVVVSTDNQLHREQLAELAAGKLRLLDSVAWDGEQLLLLLPELTCEVAPVPIGRVLEALAVLAPDVRAGFSACPDDGLDAAALLASAARAAGLAPQGKLLRATKASCLRVGDREVVAASPNMVRLFQLVERLSMSEMPVLVQGEAGVGKEVVASALHKWSRRASGPFLALNCAALPDTLIESELFGHEKGIFTGSEGTRPGMLERAAGGVVFLDEVSELSTTAQARLLRVLESRVLHHPGGKEAHLDVRVIAATDRALEREVDEGRFRRDLFHRLSAATVAVPALRERPADLPILARRFLEEAGERAGKRRLQLQRAALERLAGYRWPGNVRELKSAMDYAVANCKGSVIDAASLPQKLSIAVAPPLEPQPQASEGPPKFRDINDEIRELERTRMASALAAAGGVQVKAADLIGMSLRSFTMKAKLYQLE